MTNTFEERKEEFNRECKTINLRFEYPQYTGSERYAIVTALSEEELLERYGDVIRRYYLPYLLLNTKQWEAMYEFTKIEHKHEMRAKRGSDVYGYEDDISEQFHRELIIPFVDPIEKEEIEQKEKQKEFLRQLEIRKVRKVIAMLKPIQRERLIKEIICGQSSRKIANDEGVNYSTVDKSLAAAKKNFKKIYENL